MDETKKRKMVNNRWKRKHRKVKNKAWKNKIRKSSLCIHVAIGVGVVVIYKANIAKHTMCESQSRGAI